ncbi:MAG: hypothetical protein ACYDH0_12795 [Candidatus Aminicenantales bacterium]
MRIPAKTCIGLILFATIASGSLFSMPAFARKYSMTCKTCHSPFPKLKAYGEEFAANGFVIKDKDTPRYFVDTGDAELSLLRDVPIAFRLEGYLFHNNSGSRKLDFSSPHILKILSGGEITRHISYYFYFFFGERGEVAGLEDAFVMFNDLLIGDLDVYVGQFQISDPLFKRELRLPFEDYRIYKTKAGDSRADLTYDRGIMMTYGFRGGTDVCLEIVNGNGLDPTDPFGNFDGDPYKNFLFRLSQDVGGKFRIGGFGYLGKEGRDAGTNDLWMAGIDATAEFRSLQLNVQYLERRDDNPYFSPFRPLNTETRGGFAELVFRPKGDDSRWYALGLLNWVDSEQDDLKYASATVHYGYQLRRNVRATVEGTYVFGGPVEKHCRVGLGLVTAF